MGIDGFDHIYVETRHFDKSLDFWQALGFTVSDRWGEEPHRACRLENGEVAVVLAGAGPGGDPQRTTVHFGMRDPEALDDRLTGLEAVDVVTPLSDTHWGTRWIRVRDPDGNLYALESPRE